MLGMNKRRHLPQTGCVDIRFEVASTLRRRTTVPPTGCAPSSPASIVAIAASTTSDQRLQRFAADDTV